MPSGRCRPSGLGMYRRRTGCGRYVPARSVAVSSHRNSATPCCSIIDSVMPSMPAAPLLLRTRSHASSRTSLRQIRSYNAWKRRSSLRLAAMYSRRWSSRTFSMGLLGLATMPSRLPPYTSVTKAGSLPSSGLVDRRQRYYEPLGLPPSTIPFRHRLIRIAFARRGPPGRVSPVPYQAVVHVPSSIPRGRPASLRSSRMQSVAFAVQ